MKVPRIKIKIRITILTKSNYSENRSCKNNVMQNFIIQIEFEIKNFDEEFDLKRKIQFDCENLIFVKNQEKDLQELEA